MRGPAHSFSRNGYTDDSVADPRELTPFPRGVLLASVFLMGNTIRREVAPRRRNLGPTARLTKDAIDRLNSQERDGEVILLARGTRESVRQPPMNGSDSHLALVEPIDEPEIAIVAGPEEPESRQTSTIQGMPPIDKAPAKRAPRRGDGNDSQALVYALVALVIASALFAVWAMTR